jgi:tRNA pseudouridine55 synthase
VTVTVQRVETLGVTGNEVTFRATVSAGTYLRAIARDLGERLGVGAHLIALRREAIGAIGVDEAVPLADVSPADLRPARAILAHLPAVDLDEAGRREVLHGRPVEAPEARGSGAEVALLWGGELVAVAREAEGLLRPAVVLGQP